MRRRLRTLLLLGYLCIPMNEKDSLSCWWCCWGEGGGDKVWWVDLEENQQQKNSIKGTSDISLLMLMLAISIICVLFLLYKLVQDCLFYLYNGAGHNAGIFGKAWWGTVLEEMCELTVYNIFSLLTVYNIFSFSMSDQHLSYIKSYFWELKISSNSNRYTVFFLSL